MNRWKEHSTDEFWREVIWGINQSEFCLGKNDRGWKADFDWFVRTDTAAKVIEGKYANKNPGGASDKPKKSWWAQQNELQEKGLPNYLDGTLKDPQ